MNTFVLTNEQFYDEHPELNGRKLTNDPSDAALRKEYMKMYRDNKKTTTSDVKKVTPTASNCIHPETESKKDDNKKCNANSLQIQKDKSKYTLTIPKTNILYKDIEYNDINTLEIVSGPKQKPSKVTIKALGLVGPCPELHTNSAFNFNQNDIIVISQSDSALEFQCFSGDIRAEKTFSSFKEILKFIFINDSIIHNINYSLCGFDYPIKLSVFPEIEAKASLSLKFERDFSKVEDESTKKSFEDKLKYSFEIKHSEISLIKLESESRDKDVGFVKFLTNLLDNLAYVNKGLSAFLGESQSIKLTLSPSISATCSLKEVGGKPFVDHYYKVSIGFSPLFQLEANADVSGEILLAIPVYGPFLAAAVAAAKTAKLADVFIGFKIKGKIELNSEFERQAGESDVEKNIVFKCDIKINLVGKVSTDLSAFHFQYSCGAKVGAESGFKVEDSKLLIDGNGLYFPLKIKFLGIILYYQTWQNKGVSLSSSDAPRVAKIQNGLGEDTLEIEETENMPDSNKKTIVEESTVYDGNFYIM